MNLSRVGPENETTYNEDFYNSLDVICNALDNVKTRLYIDSKSIEYQKALIESGRCQACSPGSWPPAAGLV